MTTTFLSNNTASKRSLLRRCSWPFHPDRVWPAFSSSAASVGRQVHAFCEDYANGKEPDLSGADADALNVWDVCQADVRALIDSGGWRAEVAYALTPGGDAMQLKRAEHRDYSEAPAGSTCGTVDLDRANRDLYEVVDWEVSASNFGGYKEPVRVNDQLRFAAFVGSAVHGSRRARISIAKLRPSGMTVESCELDEFDLSAIGEDIAAVNAEAVKRINEPRPGWWCSGKFCPVAGECPAAGDAIAEVAKGAGHLIPEGELTAKIQSANHAASMLPRLKLVDRAVKQIKQALRTYSDEHGPFPTSNGKVYGKRMRNRPASTRSIAAGKYAWYGEYKP